MYESRLAAHRAEIARLTKRERAISAGRLAAFAGIVVVALIHWSWIVLVPAIVFVALVIASEPVTAAKRRAAAAAAFCERGLLRLRGEWAGKGDGGSDFAEEHHPFAADLDLFGAGSLFELISNAATAAGRTTLAEWLKHPERVTGAEVRARQEAVGELRDGVELREDLFVLASEVSGEIEGAHFGEWAAEEPLLASRGERLATIAASLFGGAALVLAIVVVFSRLVAATNPGAVAPLSSVWMIPFIAALLLRGFLGRRLHARVARVIGAVERREPALALLARLLGRLERERFSAPRLAALRAKLERDGTPASRRIEKLRGLVALLDARRNQLFAPFAAMLLWGELVAFAIERWRRESGHEIVTWMEAVGELEALLSLASFAYEQPAFAVPEIVDGDAMFDAAAAAHPLIREERRIANDVHLGGALRLLIVSGSNMSGKSTLLRTVGINAVLALAGAPVCARSLRVAPMAIGASISIHDSLAEGASRFYAEILRIRQIIGMEPPLLFLLDELLHGTNSHDRRIGAEAIVRGLVERGAIGLATTHDLALAHIADELVPRAANVHFEDHLDGDAIVFDYRMRPGVVTKSNALALMRAVGIEVLSAES
jgi:hypothetical protein